MERAPFSMHLRIVGPLFPVHANSITRFDASATDLKKEAKLIHIKSR